MKGKMSIVEREFCKRGGPMKGKKCLLRRNSVIAVAILQAIFWLFSGTIVYAERDISPVANIAVFDFQPSGAKLADTGSQIAVLLNAYLSRLENIIVVERQELEILLKEQELGISGIITHETAGKIGAVTGAKILVTGRVFESASKVFIAAKIIGTETSRIYAEIVTIPDIENLEQGVENLARKINETVSENINFLVAKQEKPEDIAAKLKKLLSTKKLPTVSIKLKEEHFGKHAVDPAAETEIAAILNQAGFTIIDPSKSNKKPDIAITGEGFSEFAMQKGNLYSCKGRIELKAVEAKTGILKAAGHQTEIAIDLSELIAGKKALQNAATKLIEKLAPQLVEKQQND